MRNKWLWLIIALAIALLLYGWFADPLGREDQPAPSPRPAAQSTEWTVEPTGPAVPVTLPQTGEKASPATPESEEREERNERE